MKNINCLLTKGEGNVYRAWKLRPNIALISIGLSLLGDVSVLAVMWINKVFCFVYNMYDRIHGHNFDRFVTCHIALQKLCAHQNTILIFPTEWTHILLVTITMLPVILVISDCVRPHQIEFCNMKNTVCFM